MTLQITKALYRSYHLLFVSTNANCRFTPTCSKYALVAIEKYGFARGLIFALKRLMSCQPFSTRPFYDPV